MANYRFYRGQKVVCINDQFASIEKQCMVPIKKGEQYIIHGIRKECCSVVVDIGIKLPLEYQKMHLYCPGCGACINHNNIWLFYANRFAPVKEITLPKYHKEAVKKIIEASHYTELSPRK